MRLTAPTRGLGFSQSHDFMGGVLLLVHIRQIEGNVIQQLPREVGNRRSRGWISALLVPVLMQLFTLPYNT